MSSMYGRGGGAVSSQQGNKLPKGYEAGRLQQFTPEMMQLFSQMFGQVSPDSYTGRLAAGDESLFEEMERPALRQFSGLQGNLAARFSGQAGGQGPLSSLKSSGFRNEANAQSSDFAQDLQSRRQELRRQAIQDLHGMSKDLLSQKPYDNFVTEKPPSWLQQILGLFGPEGTFGGKNLAQFGKTAAMFL